MHERASALVRRALERLDHLRARLALRAVDRLGERPRVDGAPFVENLGSIEIGDDVRLRAGSIRTHLVTSPRGALRIGHGVTIGAGAAIAATTRIDVGDEVHLGRAVMILDSDYHGEVDRSAPGASSAIVIGRGARLCDGVTVLRGSRIGAGAFIARESVVSGVVPERARAAGAPARIVASVGAARADALAVNDAVQRVIMEALALDRPMAPHEHPSRLDGWDSLAQLRLLVALEESFHITLPERELCQAPDLVAIAELVMARMQ